MTALPAKSSFTDSALQKEQVRQSSAQIYDYLSGLLGNDGLQATALATLGAALNGVVAKSASYTIILADRGKVFDCTGTWTASLLAATTAGSGFVTALRNSGSGVITIDPNATETIDGSATITLASGETCICVCTGTAWITVGRIITPTPVSYPISVANGGTGATSAASARDGLSVVSRNHGDAQVGSFAYVYAAQGSGDHAPGSAVSGTSLFRFNQSGAPVALTGTWVILFDMAGSSSPGATHGLAQRIA